MRTGKRERAIMRTLFDVLHPAPPDLKDIITRLEMALLDLGFTRMQAMPMAITQ
jgi:hypothetical protein